MRLFCGVAVLFVAIFNTTGALAQERVADAIGWGISNTAARSASATTIWARSTR